MTGSIRFCPHCGTPQTRADARFCQNCGRPLRERQPTPQPATSPVTPPQPATPPVTPPRRSRRWLLPILLLVLALGVAMLLEPARSALLALLPSSARVTPPAEQQFGQMEANPATGVALTPGLAPIKADAPPSATAPATASPPPAATSLTTATPAATATPPPTATPRPTATSLPTATPTPFAVVQDTVNLRGGPNQAFAQLGQLAAGETLEVLGRNETADWLQVRAPDGTIGWVVARLVDTSSYPPNEFPVVAAPSLPACAIDPASRFAGLWQDQRSLLGCPVSRLTNTSGATQRFENGRMIWRQNTDRIYVLHSDGEWSNLPDISVEGAPEPNLFQAPAGLFVPVRGFGATWHQQLGGAGNPLGWAVEQEYAVPLAIQDFENGLMVELEGRVYLLGDDGARWFNP